VPPKSTAASSAPRVPARCVNLSVAANRSIYDISRDDPAVISLHGGEILEFVSSQGLWTHDPLDTIEKDILVNAFTWPAEWPLSRPASDQMISSAQAELQDQLKFVISHILVSYGVPELTKCAVRSLTSAADNVKFAAKLLSKMGISVPVYLQHLIPYVDRVAQQLGRTRRPLQLKLTEQDSVEAKTAIAFWRRVRARPLITAIEEQKPGAMDGVGPWHTGEGRAGGKAGAGARYPLATAAAGACIAVAGRFDDDGVFHPESIHRFCKLGDRITASKKIAVALLMNDERIGDNYGEISVKCQVIASGGRKEDWPVDSKPPESVENERGGRPVGSADPCHGRVARFVNDPLPTAA